MPTPTLPILSIDDLHVVVGGVSGGAVPKQPQDNRDWTGRLTDTLKKRGFNPDADPKMERRPPSIDPGILQPRPNAKRREIAI